MNLGVNSWLWLVLVVLVPDSPRPALGVLLLLVVLGLHLPPHLGSVLHPLLLSLAGLLLLLHLLLLVLLDNLTALLIFIIILHAKNIDASMIHSYQCMISFSSKIDDDNVVVQT